MKQYSVGPASFLRGGLGIIGLLVSMSTAIADDWVDQVVKDGEVGNGYGHGQFPSWGNRTHPGVDIGGGCGLEVAAPARGAVVRVVDINDSRYSSVGNAVVLQHMDSEETIFTAYFHLKAAPLVKIGRVVSAGQIVGYTGDTGVAKGCHLHFEVRRFDGIDRLFHPEFKNIYLNDDQRTDASFRNDWLDPVDWLNEQTVQAVDSIDTGTFSEIAPGLKARTLRAGDGPVAKRGDRVYFDSTVWLYDSNAENSRGRFVTTSEGRWPIWFSVGGRGEVMRGWGQGIEGMRVGEVRELIIAPELGYRSRQSRDLYGVPAGSTLISKVEVVAVSEADGLPSEEDLAQLAPRPFDELAKNPHALRSGAAIYTSLCANCHGAGGHGAKGVPDLTDDDWQWGNSEEDVFSTIRNGRTSVMPSWAKFLGSDEAVTDMARYVRSLSGLEKADDAAMAMQAQFQKICSACHTPAGTGNQLLGAPNLTDDVWLYGSSLHDVRTTLVYGRTGTMPYHREGGLLGPNGTKIVAAYVYSLSQQ